MEEQNKCSAVIGAFNEVFSYLCVNPNPTNATCDLHESVTGIKDFEQSAWKAHEKKPPTKNRSPPPPSG